MNTKGIVLILLAGAFIGFLIKGVGDGSLLGGVVGGVVGFFIAIPFVFLFVFLFGFFGWSLGKIGLTADDSNRSPEENERTRREALGYTREDTER